MILVGEQPRILYHVSCITYHVSCIMYHVSWFRPTPIDPHGCMLRNTMDDA
jgi:hypothetical protein